jgi:hypothetical protein
VITLPSTLGSVRTLTPVVAYRRPVALGEALLAAALVVAVVDGAKVGGFSLAEGLARNAFAEAELLTAGREASSRLVRGEAVAVAVGVGVATGAGTAAVYSGCGQMATATAVARTPMKATGATTRPTRTASGGRAARRGRERANLNHSPEYIRPRSNRYLCGSLSIYDHKLIFSGPKAGRCGEGHIYAPKALASLMGVSRPDMGARAPLVVGHEAAAGDPEPPRPIRLERDADPRTRHDHLRVLYRRFEAHRTIA